MNPSADLRSYFWPHWKCFHINSLSIRESTLILIFASHLVGSVKSLVVKFGTYQRGQIDNRGCSGDWSTFALQVFPVQLPPFSIEQSLYFSDCLNSRAKSSLFLWVNADLHVVVSSEAYFMLLNWLSDHFLRFYIQRMA